MYVLLKVFEIINYKSVVKILKERIRYGVNQNI